MNSLMETEVALNIVPDKNEHSPSTSRLGLCEVCGFHEGKYTCPKCEVKTCSLKCSRIHKIEVECTGERDRTKFIPMNKFTNLDLSSDYRLLEEISRSIELSRKKFGKRMKHDIPFSLIKLRNAAAARKTVLKFLPMEFERHKYNSTELDAKKNLIFWHINWIFVNADNLLLKDEKVPESMKISSVLNKYLIKQEDAVLQEKLQYYQAADIPGMKILLKAEQRKGKQYYELDPTESIKDCLKNKIIIEHPTMCVILKGHDHDYNTIDSDCEEEIEIKKEVNDGMKVVDNIIKNAESTDSLYSSLKNLLFISEYSDDDLSE